jgi:CO/xanthine dehydrogenase FAD-binding subunit
MNMNLSIASSDSLEAIKQNSTCPDFLVQVLESSTTYQKRAETSLLSSLRAKTNFAEWIAALLILDPTVLSNGGKTSRLSEFIIDEASSIQNLSRLEITVDEKDMLDFEKVANTPADRSIVSVFVFLKFVGSTVSQARITATGVSKSALDVVACSSILIGKELTTALIHELKTKLSAEINPPDSYLGTSQYKKEMAAVLIEKIMLKKLNGEN